MISDSTHDEIDAGLMCPQISMRICHPSVMMRAVAVREAGCYRDEFSTGEDLDLFLRLAEIGKLANLPDVLFEYRQHLGSITHFFKGCRENMRRPRSRRPGKRRGTAMDPGRFPETNITTPVEQGNLSKMGLVGVECRQCTNGEKIRD